MSRVHQNQKFMNTNTYPSHVTGSSKIVRIKGENPDPTKAKSLVDWLFLKYDMTYKAFCRKSKGRKDELRAEYTSDTGRIITPNSSHKSELEELMTIAEPLIE